MAQSIFSLFGEVFVETDKAESSLSKTEEKAGGVAQKFEQGIKTAAKWGTTLVAGTTAAVGSLVKFADSSAETADNIDKMSQRLGMTRQGFQELDFALSQSGVDINSFQTGMKSLLKNMDAVTEGNKTATANFEKLGVSVVDSNGKMKDQETVLWETITAFQNMEDSAEKSRLAQEMFGKQGQEIIPLLNAQSGGIEEMRKQAHELGLVLDDELIDSGVELHDSLDQTKRAFSSIVTQLGGALIPIVTKLSDYIQQSLPQIQAFIGQLAPVLVQMFENLLPPFMQVVEQLLPALMEFIMQLLPPLTEIISAVLPVFIDLVAAIAPILTSVLELLSPLINLILEIIQPLVQIIGAVLPQFINIVKTVISVAIEPLKLAFSLLGTVIGSVLNGALSNVKSIFEGIKGVFNGLITFIKGVFTGNWKQAWEGIKSIFKSVFDSLVNILKMPFNTIIKCINKVFESVNKVKIPDWVPVIGGAGFHLPMIPLLAKGGTITESGAAIVGEAGAELIEMPEGARVTPLEANGDFGAKLDSIVDMMQQFMPLIGRGQVVLDTGATVGALAPQMDYELGRRASMRGRFV